MAAAVPTSRRFPRTAPEVSLDDAARCDGGPRRRGRGLRLVGAAALTLLLVVAFPALAHADPVTPAAVPSAGPSTAGRLTPNPQPGPSPQIPSGASGASPAPAAPATPSVPPGSLPWAGDVPPTGTDGTTPDTGSPGGCADGAADCSPQPSTPPPPSAHTTPTAPSTGGGGGGIVGWITSGITSAINSFFRGLVTAALDPLLDLLGKTLLTTPMPSQIPAIGESTSLPAGLLASLLSMGQDSPHWLARREAAALADDQQLAGRRHLSAPSRPEAFRRLRGQRRIQIALDVRDTDQAVTVAKAVAEAGLDFVEVGDPLIKQAGVGVIEHIKRQVPDLTVVAEMMSADWGRDQVELAAEAGADVVFLIGPATEASVSAAVAAGRRLGVPIVLDVPKLLGSPRWVHDMERAGVDGFAITTNIDLGVVGHQPMSGARILRGWTQLPVAVSGGFSATDYTPLASSDWDILIVGRAVTEAVNPTVAATRLAQAVSRLAPKEDQ